MLAPKMSARGNLDEIIMRINQMAAAVQLFEGVLAEKYQFECTMVEY